MWDWQETKQQTDLQKSAVRLRRHRTLSPTERPRHFSTLGTMETGRKKNKKTQKRWIPGTPWPNLETGAGPADHYLPPAHRALWSECPSEEDWYFRHFPLWVRTSWPNPRTRPSVLPNIYRETSANMATRCWSGDQAVGLGINRTEDLTCTAVDRWRRRRSRSLTSWQCASVSEGRICSDNCTCCNTEIEAADQTGYLILWYADTGPTSPRCLTRQPLEYKSIKSLAWLNMEKIHDESGNRTQVHRSQGGRLTTKPTRRCPSRGQGFRSTDLSRRVPL